MKARIAIAASLTALSLALAMPASALKYAEPEHNLKVDPSMPSWQPGWSLRFSGAQSRTRTPSTGSSARLRALRSSGA